MTGSTPSNPAVLRQQLRQAVFDCRERGLTEAATWAAQQLNGLPKCEDGGPSTSLRSHADGEESDAFLYAKALFDGKVRTQTRGSKCSTASTCCFAVARWRGTRASGGERTAPCRSTSAVRTC